MKNEIKKAVAFMKKHNTQGWDWNETEYDTHCVVKGIVDHYNYDRVIIKKDKYVKGGSGFNPKVYKLICSEAEYNAEVKKGTSTLNSVCAWAINFALHYFHSHKLRKVCKLSMRTLSLIQQHNHIVGELKHSIAQNKKAQLKDTYE